MKAVKIQYTVQSPFVDTNVANIRKVMEALKANPIDGLSYTAFQLGDGQMFMHVVVARDDEAQSKIPQLPEFEAFQNALKESNPVSPPSPEELSVVGTSFEL